MLVRPCPHSDPAGLFHSYLKQHLPSQKVEGRRNKKIIWNLQAGFRPPQVAAVLKHVIRGC